MRRYSFKNRILFQIVFYRLIKEVNNLNRYIKRCSLMKNYKTVITSKLCLSLFFSKSYDNTSITFKDGAKCIFDVNG